MPGDEQPSTVDQLQEAVDAVLVPHGFAAGQVGVSDGRREVVWCAATRELATRFPALLTSQMPAGGWGTMCTDVVLQVSGTHGHWRVSDVSVEGEPLSQLLSSLNRPVLAERAAGVIGSTTDDCLTSLPSLLAELLDGAKPMH
ncbi:hypothetical protein [Kineococcus sp. G2]|uniref:hypothetical protein n=1 Tax=Kineococcus sp. G2 TaxID=3127484 RepID=UPI00301E0515